MQWQDERADESFIKVKNQPQVLKNLWRYISRHKGLLALAALLIVASTATSILTPWLLGYTIDNVILSKKQNLVALFAGLILVTNILQAVSMFFRSYVLALLGQKTMHQMRQDLLAKFQFYPVEEFNKNPAGKLVTRLVNDTSSLQDLFSNGIALALGNIAVIVGTLFWLVVLDVKLGLICISVFPVMALVTKVLGAKIHQSYRNARSALSRLNAFLAENISGMWIIQLFNKQNTFRDRFHFISNIYTKAQLQTVLNFAYLQPSITVLSSISMAVLIWYGGLQSIAGTVTLGLLVAFMSYLQALYAPIRDITEKYNVVIAALASCERIFEFMDLPVESGVRLKKRDFDRLNFRGDIEFKNVSFQYQATGPAILKNVSFKIKEGQKIGIVGHTGAGKTTLSALLMRFYDVTSGTILVNGHDISCLSDKRTVRKEIGYIQQEPFLFSGTIEDNLFLWQAERKQAFENLPAFAKAPFENGNLALEKRIYEKGANLSCGERQIISFVRALVQEPQILVLDEATAHIDVLTEQWIERVSNQLFKDKTVLIIAHRLSTLKTASKILVIDHGQLIEEGAHQDLLKHNGYYKKLHDVQFQKEENQTWKSPITI